MKLKRFSSLTANDAKKVFKGSPRIIIFLSLLSLLFSLPHLSLSLYVYLCVCLSLSLCRSLSLPLSFRILRFFSPSKALKVPTSVYRAVWSVGISRYCYFLFIYLFSPPSAVIGLGFESRVNVVRPPLLFSFNFNRTIRKLKRRIGAMTITPFFRATLRKYSSNTSGGRFLKHVGNRVTPDGSCHSRQT